MSPDARRLGQVCWIDLSTPDVDAAAVFYSSLLGWRLESADTPLGRYVSGVTDAGPVAGMMAPPAADGEGVPPAWTVFFGVADAAAAFDRAGSLGATGLQPPTEVPGGSLIAVVSDPAGAVVGLMESRGSDPLGWGRPGAAAWVELQSRAVDASVAFYGDLLDWTPAPEDDGYRILHRQGQPVAGAMAMPPEVPAEVPSYWLVYFAVDDVDAAVRRVEELGGSVVVPTMTVQEMRFAVVADPAGAVFALLRTSG
ncbi:VOC family protein [Blastococcus aggregatus]|nr:VOC family protein [Blastococcus aggregatus]